MNFKAGFTTKEIKDAVNASLTAAAEEKEMENKKIVVSNDAFLNAEMISNLINKIEHARLSLIK